MKYHKWMGIAGVFCIVFLGAVNAWADDAPKTGGQRHTNLFDEFGIDVPNIAAQCEKFYEAGQYKQAFPICRKAANHGNAGAQSILGDSYAFGWGVKQDYSKAEKWYRKAAKQGITSSQFNLGVMYANGKGVEQNYAEAVKWYRKAANQGYANAQYSLGFMYDNGQGVKQDYAEAVKWYRKAADQGHAGAQNNLGGMYGTGQGVKQDYAEAMKLWRKAAEQGNADAQYNLGVIYENGQGVKQDYAEAVKWYRKAADQGNAGAQFNLGVSYSTGQGVMTSGAAAADWYYKAGLSFLKDGNRDNALLSEERIKKLGAIPNAFLADKLLARIYGGNGTTQATHKKKQKKAALQVVSGTGWPVAGGYVVTNHHVVAGRKTIVLLRMDGTKIPASVAVDDATNDLALLKPKNSKLLPPALPLANRAARVGGHVFTVGYPHPGMMGKEPKLTDGIINARTGIKNDPRVYQISVPLQGGNSGGPLINMHGEVVGVTTSKMSAVKVFKWTGDLPQNVNYAVKVGYVRALLSSVDPVASVPVLPAKKASLAGLAKRIEGSVLMVIAQ